jgi:uncharacterized protein YndB with AHSA1/START domain
MITMKETKIVKDASNKALRVTREFDAPPNIVWNAWTQSEILDQWWAPKPWKARTKSMDFREGGFWLYAMLGPDGEQHWARADFRKILTLKSYDLTDAFCDENGVVDASSPHMDWHVQFVQTADGTTVSIDITFESEADLQKIVEMGFKEGFTAAHGNLDELLATQTM